MNRDYYSRIEAAIVKNPCAKKSWLRFLVLIVALFTSIGAFTADRVTFIHTDLYGSPVAATNESAEVVWRAQHTPYGEEVSRSDFPRDSVGYTGHLFDNQTDLSYFQARTYDPAVGRFMGIDPVGVDAGNPHSFNRYVYANNNPYRYVDPDGRAPIVPILLWSVGALLTFWDVAGNDPVPGAEKDAIAPVHIFPGPVNLGTLKKGGELVAKGADDLFKAGRTPKASELRKYAEQQGWKSSQTTNGPLKYTDENGISRLTIKQGSSRAPGSANPHMELRNATGQRVDPAGNPVTRTSPGNHTPIDFDL